MTDDRTSPALGEPEVVDLRPRRRPAREAGSEPRRHLDLWLKFEVDTAPPPVVAGRSEHTKLLFRSDETLAQALQRSCLEQFDIAITHLADPHYDRDVAIHTARKAMKRIRAVLRLVRDYIGHDIYRAENVVLRDSARRLSAARTAAVMLRALDHLVEHFEPNVDPGVFVRLRNALRRSHEEITASIAGDADLIENVIVVLEAARVRFAAWPTAEAETSRSSLITGRVIPDDFASIEPGIRRVYRRGTIRMAQAFDRPSDEAFHEWRKRVKYLRYQMEALRPLWPDVVGGLDAALNELSETLGEEHDLAELAVYALVNRDSCTDGERRLLGALVAKRRRELHEEAAAIGHRVYAETPVQFTARIGAYWEAWRAATGRVTAS
jgi:CHAD domain-containing protein